MFKLLFAEEKEVLLLRLLLSFSQLVPNCNPPLLFSLLFTLELFPPPDPLRLDDGLLLLGDRRIDDLKDPYRIQQFMVIVFILFWVSLRLFDGGNDRIHLEPGEREGKEIE